MNELESLVRKRIREKNLAAWLGGEYVNQDTDVPLMVHFGRTKRVLPASLQNRLLIPQKTAQHRQESLVLLLLGAYRFH